MRKNTSRMNTDVWQKYEICKNNMLEQNIFNMTEKAWNFYEGRQWEGAETGGENLPFYNLIEPSIKYKVAAVAQNDLDISFTPINVLQENKERMAQVCSMMDTYAKQLWEKLDMKTKLWDLNISAAVGGDAYLYLYDDEHHAQILDNTSIYLPNEQESDLQKQPYIIIAERMPVNTVKRIAKENGLKEDEIRLIMADEDLDTMPNVASEVKTEDGKCTVILYMEKRDGKVFYLRAAKNVIYQPEREYAIDDYPIINLIWERKHNSARGRGAVTPLIPNQIEVNRLLVRRTFAVKQAAFPKMVYLDGKINNPADLEKVGTTISVRDVGIGRINDIIGYLQPSAMSADAHNLAAEMLLNTRELAGAGDAVIGNINPEKASGAAIVAARDQASIPLNRQIQSMAEFVEKLARLWFKMWRAFNPNGLTVEEEGEQMLITPEELDEMEVHIRVDVSPANPFSRFARQNALDMLFQAGQLSFDEYVFALDEASNVPKGKLESIVALRQEQGQGEAPMDEEGIEMMLQMAQADGEKAGEEKYAQRELEAEIGELREI